MGLLRRLLRTPTAASPVTSTSVATLYYEGDHTLEVVGESHYQDALWQIVGGPRPYRVEHDVGALLVPEPSNAYDENAVMVLVSDHLVGYLSRDDAAVYGPGVQQLRAGGSHVGLYGVIVGGGQRDDGIGFLGVFLHHNPEHFGVSAARAADMPALRTGLSQAMATDLADDSYDLSWYTDLSSNPIGAIRELRALLKHDPDPIDRHYMMNELEERLYKSRDVFASALDEYEEVCRQHDSEMDGIRSALLDKFGKVPVLDTYRQAAIRCQKAKDWPTMLWWAERGLALYGTEAARPEVVNDLEKRRAYATAKLAAS